MLIPCSAFVSLLAQSLFIFLFYVRGQCSSMIDSYTRSGLCSVFSHVSSIAYCVWSNEGLSQHSI